MTTEVGIKAICAAYFSSLVTMLLFDGVWLGTMMKRFYRPRMASLIADSPRLGAAGAFYLLYVFGLTFLIVLPAVRSQSGLLKAFLFGALLGLTTYGTYDLTNQATLRDWPLSLTLVDLAWGCALTGIVSTAAVFCTRLVA